MLMECIILWIYPGHFYTDLKCTCLAEEKKKKKKRYAIFHTISSDTFVLGEENNLLLHHWIEWGKILLTDLLTFPL